MSDFKWFMVATLIVFIIGAIIGINSDDKGYQLIEPEPGIKCVKVSGVYNDSVSCWKETFNHD